MTHEDAMAELLEAADLYKHGAITRLRWFARVDAVITAVELRASGPQPEPAYAPDEPRPASRRNTVGDTRRLAASLPGVRGHLPADGRPGL